MLNPALRGDAPLKIKTELNQALRETQPLDGICSFKMASIAHQPL